VSEIDSHVIERVMAAKARRASSEEQYLERARVGFVIHSFNRESNISALLAGVRQVEDHELIVCDDGSLDGSRRKWESLLVRPNDFLILSNDLHEIRILDRAIRFAGADIVCLVQDDDQIPQDTAWLDQALDQFQQHDKLAILGGFMGFNGFDTDPGNVERFWGEAPFRFVEHVNIGPYFIRKQYYEALGGWDPSFSAVGEPGICFDNELCLRAWMEGFQVGYHFVPFKGPAGTYQPAGGTVIFSSGIRRRNQLRNESQIFRKYKVHAERIAELVRRANSTLPADFA
jgi:glycosyltransferase involved in cell wall biosynthesis